MFQHFQPLKRPKSIVRKRKNMVSFMKMNFYCTNEHIPLTTGWKEEQLAIILKQRKYKTQISRTFVQPAFVQSTFVQLNVCFNFDVFPITSFVQPKIVLALTKLKRLAFNFYHCQLLDKRQLEKHEWDKCQLNKSCLN